MFDTDIANLDADATLAAAVQARADADRAEVRLLAAAAHWADLHGEPERLADGRSLPGMERLLAMGGPGTPKVAEFASAELGAALAMSAWAAQRLIGDALDLRHRLPALWARIRAGQVRPWIGRKTAEATRTLSTELVAAVDAAVTPWADSLSWGRLDNLIGATVMAAEPELAAKAAREAATGQGVWVGQGNESGIKTIFIRTETPNAVWFDAAVERIADSLEILGDTASKDVRRGRAVGILAQPQQALNLFQRTAAAAAGQPAPEPVPSGVDARPPATLYVHVSQDAFTRDGSGVARFEGEGPITTEQAQRWLGHCQVSVKPVIDLADQAPVDAYEIPDRLREAIQLRNPVDVFPYATNTGRRRQLDHTIPYRPPDDGGPPGQTGIHNLGPMTAFHHRVKTHSRWQVRQPFDGVYVWRSPHGRHYLVDHTGTHQSHRRVSRAACRWQSGRVLERSRRAVFNEDAELYDRARPAYPGKLVDDLLEISAIRPAARVLEIGPGTGQATQALVARGAEVVAVELGPSLALVLRRKLPTVQVVVADFDTWPAPEGAFDAVMAFTSWHWLDPATRGRKVATALRPAGALATVTTSHVSGGTASFFADVQRCYERWDPETPEALRLPEPEDVPVWRDEVDEDPAFLTAERRRYLTDIAYRTGEYVDLLRTYSGHRALDPEAQRGLLDCVGALIENHYAGQIVKRYLYELRVARRA